MNIDFQDSAVAAVFDAYPLGVQGKLLALRSLIFSVAADTPDVGQITEALKWGQPSYLTVKPKSGTTIRIHADTEMPARFSLYVNCQTSLISDWRTYYPNMHYSGTRAVHFDTDEPFPAPEMRHCIGLALTYHSRKKKRAS